MENFRETLSNLIYGAIGIVSSILIIRIILDIGQIGSDFPLSNVMYPLSDLFMYPFKGIISIQNPNLNILNADAIVALGVYIIGGMLAVKIITGFMYDNLYDITQNFVDGFFKLFEFIVGLRILFAIFSVLPSNTSQAFVDAIFSWSNWTQTVLIRIPLGTGYIDISAILWFIVLVILDVFSGRYLAKVLGGTVVIATVTTSVIKRPASGFSFPSFRKPSVTQEVVTKETKEIYIEPPKA